MTENRHDLIVIGAGPGGYIAALRAAQLGLDVACVERERLLGGTCLRVGCIPSKALLESSELWETAREHFAGHGIGVGEPQLDLERMMSRKQEIVESLGKGVSGLFRRGGVHRYTGHARLERADRVVIESDDGTTAVRAAAVLLATGSRASSLPGVEVDGDRVVTSTEALAWQEVPPRLAVIGAGAIGLELGSVWRRLGSRVTVLEYLDRILPGTDGGLAEEARKVFESQGLRFRLGARVTGVETGGETARVLLENGEPVEVDRVLVAVGREPATAGLGLEDAGVETDAKGRVLVDERFRTTADGIRAIGDLIPGPMLAHKAEDEGVACVEDMATGHGHVNYDAIPNVVYTWPEVASVGRGEEELEEEGVDYRAGAFPFRANGRARILDCPQGRVKVLADRRTDRVLGVHILGPRAGDLIAEAATAIEFGASSEDIARICHAHPTLSEAVKEAALAVDGRSLSG